MRNRGGTMKYKGREYEGMIEKREKRERWKNGRRGMKKSLMSIGNEK